MALQLFRIIRANWSGRVGSVRAGGLIFNFANSIRNVFIIVIINLSFSYGCFMMYFISVISEHMTNLPKIYYELRVRPKKFETKTAEKKIHITLVVFHIKWIFTPKNIVIIEFSVRLHFDRFEYSKHANTLYWVQFLQLAPLFGNDLNKSMNSTRVGVCVCVCVHVFCVLRNIRNVLKRLKFEYYENSEDINNLTILWLKLKNELYQ